MKIIKKSIFPEEIFAGLEKKDGYAAVLFFTLFISLDLMLLYIVKISPLYPLIKEYSYFYRLIFVLLMDTPPILLILLILKIRKQKINTIGLKKKGLKSSIIIGFVLLVSYIFYYVFNKGFDIRLINSIIFYMIGIGFFEELVFRGFLWPRLVISFGKIWGTILSGIFFGMAHLPLDIVFYNKNLFDLVILGKSIKYKYLGWSCCSAA